MSSPGPWLRFGSAMLVLAAGSGVYLPKPPPATPHVALSAAAGRPAGDERAPPPRALD